MLAAYASTLARRTGLSVASTVVPVAVAGPSAFARCYANVVDGLKYYEEHEWVKNEGGVATIGITDHAQEALGDIVYVDLPEVGSTIEAKESIGAVESVKAASDIYTPVSGEVVEVNSALEDEPGTVNKEPYEGGWMFKLKLTKPEELDSLMDAGEYEKFCSE